MPDTHSPEPFYSLARSAGGFVFLSAFGPVDERMQVVGTTIEEQTRACMEAVGRALASQGATFDDLVCVDVFLTDLDDRDGFNAVYATYFGDRKPARRVEVTGIAHLGDRQAV